MIRARRGDIYYISAGGRSDRSNGLGVRGLLSVMTPVIKTRRW